ncbi:MAG: toll/interleukin-1 receptor domain-containing protein, partial [Bacteroidales bacterium]|nr:toll/interleukin-1 receptor domain-containing protein [Bacteroidales bacterium]
MNEKKVYISYAGKSDTIYKYAEHKVEYTQDDRQRDSIVDDLTSAFDLADIELVKDTENVVIGSGNITKFEREIGDAQYVIVVLCDKYFLSPHCMYEWDMIHQNTDNKLICYVYFADEKIIYADGELDGRSMPIKDKYADYYPLIRKTWQNWHKNLVGQHRKEIFALSDVETYACNKNLDDIYNVNEDNPYLYSQSFTVISSILKNSSVVRGAQTTNFKKNAATIIAKEFKKSFDDNI